MGRDDERAGRLRHSGCYDAGHRFPVMAEAQCGCCCTARRGHQTSHLDDAVASLDIDLTDDEVARLEAPYTPRYDSQGVSVLSWRGSLCPHWYQSLRVLILKWGRLGRCRSTHSLCVRSSPSGHGIDSGIDDGVEPGALLDDVTLHGGHLPLRRPRAAGRRSR
jgi:hypothetical protein